MPTYIALIDYTDQGIRNFRKSPARAEAFTREAEAAGVTVRNLYWTLGAHDGVLILDAPDDSTVSRVLLSLGMAGNVRTHALRAYDRAEIEDILGS